MRAIPYLKPLHRIVIAAVAVANFWYWMVLPMPPTYDAGLSYENVWQWVGSLALLAFISGLVERRPAVAASIVALGVPIAFIPYDLFGYAARPQPLEFRWDSVTNPVAILLNGIAVAFYWCAGFVLAIAPAAAGWGAKLGSSRVLKALKFTSCIDR